MKRILIIILCLTLLLSACYTVFGITAAIFDIHKGIQQQREDTQNLIRIWQQQIEDTAEFKAEWREFMDKLQVEDMDTTAYAPLDPKAVEGMCYSGDPLVTATGAKTTPGRTIATDPKVIPMGTRVYIPGVGVRVAEDKGGLIKGNRIDLAVSSRSDALQYGRKRVRAVWVE